MNKYTDPNYVPESKTETVFVTSEMAYKFLEMNTHNRNVNMARVKQYRDEILEGKYIMNHQGISFNTKCQQDDGQHRLWAIIEAHDKNPNIKGVWILVTTNADEKAQQTIDQGAQRTPHQVATLSGRFGGKVSSTHCAVAKAMYGGVTGRNHKETRRNSFLMDFMTEHWDALDFAVHVFEHQMKGVTSAAVKAVFARAFYHVEQTELKEFAHLILNGYPSDEHARIQSYHKPVLKFRDWVQSTAFSKNSDEYSRQIYGIVSRTLQKYVHKIEGVQRCKPTTNELYPLPEKTAPSKAVVVPKVVKKLPQGVTPELVMTQYG